MSAPPTANPFVPGHGQMPPYLAGREDEQSRLSDLLAYLKVGKGAPRNAVLSGPRGNGKTVMLRWLQHEIEASADMDAVWLTPSEMPSLDRLATSLVPPRLFTSLRPDTLSFSIGIGRLGWELSGQPESLTLLLAARCTRRPLVLLLDEAHTMDSTLGGILLNASQTVCAEAPFLLVMAGTPGLQPHLNTMSATFWSRAEKLGIGRLDEAAAAAALIRPLGQQTPEIRFDQAPLRHVIRESQCYPYFLQLWGAALWKLARERGATRIDEKVVASAQPEFSRSRSAYYEDRHEELERRHLLDVAVRVGAAFGEKATLRRHELNSVIAASLADDSSEQVLQCRDRLASIGYVWKPPDAEDVWQPGIPSLMDYVQSHTP